VELGFHILKDVSLVGGKRLHRLPNDLSAKAGKPGASLLLGQVAGDVAEENEYERPDDGGKDSYGCYEGSDGHVRPD
jgi:hypothetical protein